VQDASQDDKRAVASRGDAEQQARKTRRSTQEREQLSARQAEARQSAADRGKVDGIPAGDAIDPDIDSSSGDSTALAQAETETTATPLAAEVLALLQQVQHKQTPSSHAQGDDAMTAELAGIAKASSHPVASTLLDAADSTALPQPQPLPLPGADGKPAARGASIEAGEVRSSLTTGASSEAAASFQGELRQAQSSASPAIPASPVAALQPRSGNAEAPAADKADIPLQAPLESPQFAPEMAARVSVLATEGVQQAKLHLNPAEMGPVSVQIIVDGQQAQVSFVAEQSQTRSALEASLPDLASALREQGLTLAGGGVFQQSPGQSRGEREAQASQTQATHGDLAAAPGVDEGKTAVASTTPRRTGRGVVDLYA
jgi:flagellar hook-length control protein FliK